MEKNVLIHPLGFLHFMMRIKVNLSLCIIILYASTPTQFFSFINIFFYFLSYTILFTMITVDMMGYVIMTRGNKNVGICFHIC